MELFFPFELIGTIAFAVSGAMVGIEKKMDIFGISILGLTTAVGGGILRDLILNITPPAAFKDPVFAFTAIIVSIIVFLPPVRRAFADRQKIYDLIMLVMDSVGLGMFTVTGVRAAMLATGGINHFMIIFVGVLTGVGGGILRDVFAGSTPYIFVKHFYACASILGAVLCTFLWRITGGQIAMISGAALTMVLRLLAAYYRWSLPRPR